MTRIKRLLVTGSSAVLVPAWFLAACQSEDSPTRAVPEADVTGTADYAPGEPIDVPDGCAVLGRDLVVGFGSGFEYELVPDDGEEGDSPFAFSCGWSIGRYADDDFREQIVMTVSAAQYASTDDAHRAYEDRLQSQILHTSRPEDEVESAIDGPWSEGVITSMSNWDYNPQFKVEVRDGTVRMHIAITMTGPPRLDDCSDTVREDCVISPQTVADWLEDTYLPGVLTNMREAGLLT